MVVMAQHPSFHTLGPSFVCPDYVIDKICTEAQCFRSVEDLDIIGLRPELRMPFFPLYVKFYLFLLFPRRVVKANHYICKICHCKFCNTTCFFCL